MHDAEESDEPPIGQDPRTQSATVHRRVHLLLTLVLYFERIPQPVPIIEDLDKNRQWSPEPEDCRRILLYLLDPIGHESRLVKHVTAHIWIDLVDLHNKLQWRGPVLWERISVWQISLVLAAVHHVRLLAVVWIGPPPLHSVIVLRVKEEVHV